MNAEFLIRTLRENNIGLSISPEGKLILDGDGAIIKRYLETVKEHKPAILTLLQSEKPVELIRDGNGFFDMEAFIYDQNIKAVFMDTETTGLDPFSANLVLVQISAGGKTFIIDACAIPEHQRPFFYSGIKRILEDDGIIKVFHNALFDLKFLQKRVFQNDRLQVKNLFDTMLAEQLLTAGISQRGEHSLKAVCKKYLNIELDKSQQTSFKAGQPLTQAQISYAAADVQHLEPVFRIQAAAIAKENLTDIALMEFAIIPAIVNMELTGIYFDLNGLETMKAHLIQQGKHLEEELNAIVKETGATGNQGDLFDATAINYKSPVQVQKIFAALGIKAESTGIEVIEKINHPFTNKLVEYRKVSKLLSSFCDSLPKHINPATGRIHPDFFQLGTEAGRFTCQNPNVQQIPHDQQWRDLFNAPEGRQIITADYSQIELRILAEFSQDKAFLDAYRSGQDLHSRTAAEMFSVQIDNVTKEQRAIAKTINFGLCYGMSSKGLSDRLNIPAEKAENFINQYFRAYPQVKNTLQSLGMKAVKNLYSITLGGRKRYFKQADSFGGEKSLERKGRNTPIQGTCGDILKKAILYLMKDLEGYDAQIVNLIHDEIVLEVKTEQAETVKEAVKRCMVKAAADYIQSIPVEVDIKSGNTWRK
ncbi:MAG: hypothetical protein KBA28_09690 [Syntrophaceae bacterium]|nr:hypothetical protein [Syntrophaceae bacterium]